MEIVFKTINGVLITSLFVSFNSSDIKLNDKQLCQNHTFWQNRPCRDRFQPGIKIMSGRRCTGSIHHCSYRLHERYSYDKMENDIPFSCLDYSDQIFNLNSVCNATQYPVDYCKNFCNPEQTHYLDYNKKCDEICINPESWMSRQTDPDIRDPFRCQNSCADPEINCEACTHPDYKFNCTRNNIEVCLHPQLLCDGHPHCDRADDEDFFMCYEKYLRDHRISVEATLICSSLMYPSKITSVALLRIIGPFQK